MASFLCLPLAVQAAEYRQFFLTFPPYWYQDETTKQYTGLHYELAKALFKHAELNVNLVNVPYKRQQEQIKNPEVPFINFGETEGINTHEVFYTCTPPTKITLRVYSIKPGLTTLKSMDDFNDRKSIILIHGHPLGPYEPIKSKENLKISSPRHGLAAVKMLKAARADYLIAFENVIESTLKKNPTLINESSIARHDLVSFVGYPIATPKAYPEGKTLCDKVKSSFNIMVKEGLIDKESGLLHVIRQL